MLRKAYGLEDRSRLCDDADLQPVCRADDCGGRVGSRRPSDPQDVCDKHCPSGQERMHRRNPLLSETMWRVVNFFHGGLSPQEEIYVAGVWVGMLSVTAVAVLLSLCQFLYATYLSM